MLPICDAATRAVLFLYDLTRGPLQWLNHWWGSAFEWVVRHAGDGCAVNRPNLPMAHDYRPGRDRNMQALEEGLHVAAGAEGPSRIVSVSPAFDQHQCSSLLETSTRGVASRITAGQEVSELYSAKLCQISKSPSHAKMYAPGTYNIGLSFPSARLHPPRRS